MTHGVVTAADLALLDELEGPAEREVVSDWTRPTAWYHGGVRGLRLGSEVLPPTMSGVKAGADYLPDSIDAGHVRRDRVYIGTAEVAALFAAMYPHPMGGTIYEVEPVGPVEPDADYGGDDGASAQCARAVVVRVLPPLPLETVNRIRFGMMAVAEARP